MLKAIGPTPTTSEKGEKDLGQLFIFLSSFLSF
jgi:hypothetical protein